MRKLTCVVVDAVVRVDVAYFLDFQHVVIPLVPVDGIVQDVVQDRRRHVGEDGVQLKQEPPFKKLVKPALHIFTIHLRTDFTNNIYTHIHISPCIYICGCVCI